uniref:BTB domain-containing protein n=1 Tax=Panagrolaimus superbus TaxID=310955 RepID=A0A914ZEK3_9BILA
MPEIKWFLRCCVGDKSSILRRISFYITIKSEVAVDYRLEFTSIYQKDKCSFNSCCNGIERIELNVLNPEIIFKTYSFIKHKKVFVKVCGNFSYKTQPSSISLKNIVGEWGLHLMEKMTHDFDLINENRIITTSKLLLAAESDVFERMFHGNFTEAKENKATIQGYKTVTIQTAVDYCHGKNIFEFLENQENAIELLYFTNQYDFKTLKPKLEKHFATKLSKENIELFLSISDKANALELREACIDFLEIWSN